MFAMALVMWNLNPPTHPANMSAPWALSRMWLFLMSRRFPKIGVIVIVSFAHCSGRGNMASVVLRLAIRGVNEGVRRASFPLAALRSRRDRVVFHLAVRLRALREEQNCFGSRCRDEKTKGRSAIRLVQDHPSRNGIVSLCAAEDHLRRLLLTIMARCGLVNLRRRPSDCRLSPKQPLPRGTEAPLVLKGDPKLRKRRKNPWGSVSDALAAHSGIKESEVGATYPKLLARTICALRGLGEFDVAWGIGQYGKNFAEYIWRMGAGNDEGLRIHNARCKITNRLAIGLSTLKLGSEKMGL